MRPTATDQERYSAAPGSTRRCSGGLLAVSSPSAFRFATPGPRVQRIGFNPLRASRLRAELVMTQRRLIIRAALEDDAYLPLEGHIELDGAVELRTTDLNRLRKRVEIVHDAGAKAGPHELRIWYRLSGRGIGVDSYRDGYRFVIPSRHVFNAPAGSTTCVSVVVHFLGDYRTPYEQRPAVHYVDEVVAGGSANPSNQDSSNIPR